MKSIFVLFLSLFWASASSDRISIECEHNLPSESLPLDLEDPITCLLENGTFLEGDSFDLDYDSPPSFIFIQYSEVEEIPKGLMNRHGVKYFAVQDSGLPAIRKSDFDDSKHLEALSVAGNNLTYIAARLFEGAKKLRRADFSRNVIEAISDTAFAGAISLRHIDISENKLKWIYPTIFLQNLIRGSNNSEPYHIDLSANDFDYDFEVMIGDVNHTELVLNQNNLTKINVTKEKIYNVTEFSISISLVRNTIQEILIVNPGETRLQLDLSHNELKDLPELPYESLRGMNLSYNPLNFDQEGFFEPLAAVEWLSIVATSFPSSLIDTMAVIENLNSLELCHNSLAEFDLSIVNKLKNLEYLNLENNLLENLDTTVVDTSPDRYLRLLLDGNLFDCDTVRAIIHDLREAKGDNIVFMSEYSTTRGPKVEGITCSKNPDDNDLMAALMKMQNDLDEVKGRLGECKSN